MRKTRSDSKLLNLPDEKKDPILDWMLGGMSYTAVREMVAKEFGIKSSPAALSAFYAQEAPKRFIKQRLKSLSVAAEIADEAQKTPSMFAPATIERMQQLAFEQSITPGADPDTVKSFFMMMLKARDQDLESRRVALLEEKAKQAEKASGVVTDSKLTPEEKQIRLKQIFGAA